MTDSILNKKAIKLSKLLSDRLKYNQDLECQIDNIEGDLKKLGYEIEIDLVDDGYWRNDDAGERLEDFVTKINFEGESFTVRFDQLRSGGNGEYCYNTPEIASVK